ncbi:hypothetical protein HAX54_029787 [Datura stramonium]|uniref:Glycine-rich protein n=1 Tax=Datura stramonium TaxID=4076 RepID=A0ABS8V9A3_DATST|nr:hypothetical protein [Datura stramonium]
MASRKCIPLVLSLFISLSLGFAHRGLLEPTKAQELENDQSPDGVTKLSGGGGGFGWGWGSGGNHNGGGGGGGGYGGSCGSGGTPGWIPPRISPGGGCNCPTQPVPYIPCPYGCQPPPDSGWFVGNAKQIDKEKQDASDHENGNREETMSLNFQKYD